MYDAIIVGARCAGSPTAMLLARKGYRVLLVDRAIFPNDSMRGHFIHYPGACCLQRWGLMERVPPELAERVRRERREERFLGTGDLPNFFRKPYGTGWALVGDAGYHKDAMSATAISDAFRDAGLLVEALDTGFCGRQPPERGACSV